MCCWKYQVVLWQAVSTKHTLEPDTLRVKVYINCAIMYSSLISWVWWNVFKPGSNRGKNMLTCCALYPCEASHNSVPECSVLLIQCWPSLSMRAGLYWHCNSKGLVLQWWKLKTGKFCTLFQGYPPRRDFLCLPCRCDIVQGCSTNVESISDDS